MAKYNLGKVGSSLKGLDFQKIKGYAVGAFLLVITGLIVWELLKGGSKKKHVKREYNPDNLSIDPFAFATDIYNRIGGWEFLTAPRAEVLERFNALNDDEFIAVYTEYNKAFKEAPATLRTDISGEWIWDNPLGGAGILEQIDNRFNKLQLP